MLLDKDGNPVDKYGHKINNGPAYDERTKISFYVTPHDKIEKELPSQKEVNDAHMQIVRRVKWDIAFMDRKN